MVNQETGALFAVDDVAAPDHFLDTKIELTGWTAKFGRRAKFYNVLFGQYLDRVPSIAVERIREQLSLANERLGFSGKPGREPLDILRYGKPTSYQQCLAAIVAANIVFSQEGFHYRIGRGTVACAIYNIAKVQDLLDDLIQEYDKPLADLMRSSVGDNNRPEALQSAFLHSRYVEDFCKSVSARLPPGKRFSPELLNEIYFGRQVTFGTAFELLEHLRTLPLLKKRLKGSTTDHIGYRNFAENERAPASAAYEEVSGRSYAAQNPYGWPFLAKQANPEDVRGFRIVT